MVWAWWPWAKTKDRLLHRITQLLPAIIVSFSATESPAVILHAATEALSAGRSSFKMAQIFDSVGQVECRVPGKHPMIYRSTGWVVGAPDTAITAAHSFYRMPVSGQGHALVIDPGQCLFVRYDSVGKVRETTPILYAVSPWSLPKRRLDSTYDFAVIKLKHPVGVMQLPTAEAVTSVITGSTELIAFHETSWGQPLPRITRGIIRPFPAGQLRYDPRETRITSAQKMFVTSASSTPGSSGGMYYDANRQAVVGLHIGAICEEGPGVRIFNPDSCFNYGLRFDSRMVRLINAVSRSDLAAARLLVSEPVEGKSAQFSSRSDAGLSTKPKW